MTSRSSSPAPARLTSFDPSHARFTRVRVCAAACLLAFAGILSTQGGLARVLSALVLTDLVIMSLPWRVPRGGRTTRSIVLENVAYQAMPLCAVAAALLARPAWIGQWGSWLWYPAAILLGAAVVALSGLSIRRLLSGELAFLAGPRATPHGAVRVAGTLLAPPGEEVIFRGVVFLPGSFTAALSVVAVVAFVARHHVPAKVPGRIRARAIGTQFAAGIVTLLLAAASRSLYPAIAAHLVNNAPQALLEIQRLRIEGES